MLLPRISRRQALRLMASAAVLPLAPAMASASAGGGRLIVLADLHSAYERTGQLLAAIAAEIAANPGPHIILVNGDVFEAGNVVASRSAGAIDWALLAELGRLAPTVVNIGNHEPDLVDDLATFVARARALGLTVLSNIADARTGKPYTGASAEMSIGGMKLSIVGIATNAKGTYPKALRDTLDIPDPVAWAGANLPALFAGDGLPVLMSHAGVVADRAILPNLPDGTLLIGGHDHLHFDHSEGRTRYFHTGSWSTVFTVATIAADRSIRLEHTTIATDAPSSSRLAPLIAATLAEHLTDAETATVGQSAEALDLDDTGRLVAAAMASAAAGDVGFIGHTTFGTGLPKGNVSKYRFDAVVRFDGKLMVAEVDPAGLAAILARANQDGDIPLAARTGDFLYAAPAAGAAKAAYRIVANDWSAINQKSYFGREDLVFTEVPEMRIKALVAKSLAG